MEGDQVLLVDDDEVVRGLLVWLFEDAGYVVRQAADGHEALAALDLQPPDCMVLDLMMPGIDGFEVLRRREERSLAPYCPLPLFLSPLKQRTRMILMLISPWACLTLAQ